MANEPDHLLLRRYVVARERGREAEAAQIWERLTENNFDRITLLWPDNAIRNKWLQVTVHAPPASGLAGEDVFYFGHLAGESGDGSTPSGAVVNAIDQARTRSAIALARGSAPITSVE